MKSPQLSNLSYGICFSILFVGCTHQSIRRSPANDLRAKVLENDSGIFIDSRISPFAIIQKDTLLVYDETRNVVAKNGFLQIPIVFNGAPDEQAYVYQDKIAWTGEIPELVQARMSMYAIGEDRKKSTFIAPEKDVQTIGKKYMEIQGRLKKAVKASLGANAWTCLLQFAKQENCESIDDIREIVFKSLYNESYSNQTLISYTWVGYGEARGESIAEIMATMQLLKNRVIFLQHSTMYSTDSFLKQRGVGVLDCALENRNGQFEFSMFNRDDPNWVRFLVGPYSGVDREEIFKKIFEAYLNFSSGKSDISPWLKDPRTIHYFASKLDENKNPGPPDFVADDADDPSDEDLEKGRGWRLPFSKTKINGESVLKHTMVYGARKPFTLNSWRPHN